MRSNQSNRGGKVNSSTKSRFGFTLVELLVVIAIIGILAGVLIPAVTAVRKTVQTAFLRTECGNFEMAIEAYKLKYGDYPPDFSNLEIVDRHYRRIFPEILNTELILLRQLCDDIEDQGQTDAIGEYLPAAMDRAEALVWSLGGFSSDPQRPFTGSGGPVALINNAGLPQPNNIQYNITRDNALLELDPSMLTLRPADSSNRLSFTNRAESFDEENLPSVSNDVFPVYRYREQHAPYVYFDSRTYRALGANVTVIGQADYNGYVTVTDGKRNVIRPVLSDRRTTKNISNMLLEDSRGDRYTTMSYCLAYFEFVNPQSFQVLSPGLDGVYGHVNQRVDEDGKTYPIYWQYPAGNLVDPKLGVGIEYDEVENEADPKSDLVFVKEMLSSKRARYDSSTLNGGGGEAFEKDNVASFTSGSFEDDLP